MNKFLVSLFVIVPLWLFSQTQECATDEIHALRLAGNPALQQAHEAMENQAFQHFDQLRYLNSAAKSADPDYIIPVVVHIIHQNGAENISDAEVLQGIQNLNDGFANAGIYADGNGADVKIGFCLAQQDPDGNFTTGINRVESPLTDVLVSDDQPLKDLSRWDPFNYLNIWVVRKINDGFTFGFANFPLYHGEAFDGIVVRYDFFAGYQSRTLIHEAGHYLAMYHTFSNGCANNDCLMSGDLVCDTPPDNTTASASSCDAPLNSCTTDTDSGFDTDQNDLNWNFMDYGNWNCHNGFTQGQADRMRYFLLNQRTSLLSSIGCQPPCTDPLTAAFSASATSVLIGGTVNFNNASINATNYQWLLDGVPFSTAVNAFRVFNTVGTYEVTLVASNGDPYCTEEFSVVVEVLCTVEALFSVSNATPLAGTTINFYNLSDQGFNKWYVNGTLFSSGIEPTYTVPSVGSYTFTLVVENYLETCTDTFSFSLEAVCIDAKFAVSNFYPEPGEVTSFQNTSVGASTYAWTANGLPIGTTANLNHAFAQAGVYEVCLDASTPFCTDQYCRTVYVFEASGDGCEGTFYKRLAQNVAIFGNCIAAAPDGSIYMGGQAGNLALLVKAATDGSVIWSRSLDIFPQQESLTRITIDSDGMLLLQGTIASGNPSYVLYGYYTLKYDPVNDLVLWARNWDNNTNTAYFHNAVIEKEPGGNYLLLGSNNSNQFYHEIDRNTGATIFEQQFSVGVDGFLNGCTHDGDFYVAGYQGIGLAFRRASLTKLNSNGDRLWTRLYTTPPSSPAETYLSEVMVENDTIVAFGSGDFEASPGQDYVLTMMKTDLDGQIHWGKKYEIVGVDNSFFKGSTLVLPDGYVMVTNVQLFAGGNSVFILIRLDKQGNLVWAKKIFGATINSENMAVLQNGYIYFVNYGGFSYGKISLDGELVGPGCGNLADTEVIVHDFPDLYDELHPSTQAFTSINYPLVNVATAEFGLNETYYPGCVCAEPTDPCLLAADALLTNITAACQADGIEVSLTVYNNSTGDLPQGTPIAFYKGDPTVTNAELLTVQALPSALPHATTSTFTFNIGPLANLPIYVVVNDDATTPGPWSLDDFPNASAEECFFQNNIGSFQVNLSVPALDLGADVSVCDYGTAVFQAQAGFVDYTWQDGSKEPGFTAWLPGDYWVTAKDGCGGIQSDTVTFTIDPVTEADIGPDTIYLCKNEAFVLGLSGFDHYQWSPSEGVDCDTCANVVLNPPVQGIYSVVASTDDGCYSADSAWVEVIPDLDTTFQVIALCVGDTALVFGNPVTGPGVFSMNFPGLDGCDSTRIISVSMLPANLLSFTTTPAIPGQSGGSITVTASGGTPPFVYFWSNGAPNSPFIDGLAAGDYGLTVIDAFGCITTAQITVPLGVATAENLNIQRFTLAPNPTSGQLGLRLALRQPAAVQVELLDATGRTVLAARPEFTAEATWDFDLSGLPAAAYFCKLSVDGQVQVRGVVKQ